MSDDTTGLLKLIATHLYVLTVNEASRGLCGKSFWEASLPQQQAAYQAANRTILDNLVWQEGLLQQALAQIPKPNATAVGFAPGAPAPDTAPIDSPPAPAPRQSYE